MKLERDKMPNRIKKAKKDLTLLSHNFIRHRDSINDFEIKGYCFDCGKLCEGSDFQCGHFIPDSVGGALLRYHPHNMHGQASSCNCGYSSEMVKIRYTQAILSKYSESGLNRLLELKNKSIKADILFYNQLIDLYKENDENKIVEFLESL